MEWMAQWSTGSLLDNAKATNNPVISWPEKCHWVSLPSWYFAVYLYRAAKASVANIRSATFKNHAHHHLCSTHIYWTFGFKSWAFNCSEQIFTLSKLVHCGRDWWLASLKNNCYSFFMVIVTLFQLLFRWNIITNPECALCQTPQPTYLKSYSY